MPRSCRRWHLDGHGVSAGRSSFSTCRLVGPVTAGGWGFRLGHACRVPDGRSRVVSMPPSPQARATARSSQPPATSYVNRCALQLAGTLALHTPHRLERRGAGRRAGRRAATSLRRGRRRPGPGRVGGPRSHGWPRTKRQIRCGRNQRIGFMPETWVRDVALDIMVTRSGQLLPGDA
jgi:hypothetical protein